MSRMILISGLLAGVFNFAAAVEEPCPAVPEESRITAVEEYLKGVRSPLPEERIREFLKALELDPDAAAPLQMLQHTCKAYPAKAKMIARGLLDVAEKHPGHPVLSLTAVQGALRFVPQEENRTEKLISDAVSQTEAPDRLAGAARAAYFKLAEMELNRLIRAKKYEEAFDLTECISDQFSHPEILFSKWQTEIAGKAMRQAPDSRRLLGLQRSERSMWRERFQDAIEAVRSGEKDITRLDTARQTAFFYVKNGCFNDALRIAENTMKRQPGNPDAEVLQITVLMQTRHYQESFHLAEKLNQRIPENEGALKILADSALRSGNYATAGKAGEKLQNFPKQADFGRFFMVMAALLDGKSDQAAKTIRKIRDPQLKLVLEMQLLSRDRQDRTQIAKLERLARDPKFKGQDGILLSMLAIAERSGDVKLLEKCWSSMEQRGMLKEPENANNIGYVAAVLNYRVPDARKLIEFALERVPGSNAYLDSLAWAEFRMGENDLAMKHIREAIEASAGEDSIGVILDHAGDIALKLGHQAEALDFYLQAQGDYLSQELDHAALRAKIRKLKLKKGLEQ